MWSSQRDRPARVAGMPVEPLPGADFPLRVVVVIDTDPVDGGQRATNFGCDAATQHVPHLPLVTAEVSGSLRHRGLVGRRHHMSQRLDVHEFCPAVCGADGIDAAQGSLHQSRLNAVPVTVSAIATHDVRAGHGPGQKPDLVDRVVDRRHADVLAQMLGSIGRDIGEVFRKVGVGNPRRAECRSASASSAPARRGWRRCRRRAACG